ncbi:MAG TPA: hypothetical protein VM123_02665, partial [archaeon]|nr:hypothetical protein [archaeon]
NPGALKDFTGMKQQFPFKRQPCMALRATLKKTKIYRSVGTQHAVSFHWSLLKQDIRPIGYVFS